MSGATKDRPVEAPFSVNERAALHSLAEMFQDKKSRDELRRLVHEGTTLREIILAYKTNRRLVSTLKTVGGLIMLLGGSVAALKGLGLWPK
ncbi:hypothetical protein [Falsiruegeria mediterranea]|uniref:hypothetical protein n=1 Tax=Falsiruegeria mediterranea TaxID=1280832 RepID=UPI0015F250CD|nr:hypothetical protein [Falsiruegeria mediterranea]